MTSEAPSHRPRKFAISPLPRKTNEPTSEEWVTPERRYHPGKRSLFVPLKSNVGRRDFGGAMRDAKEPLTCSPVRTRRLTSSILTGHCSPCSGTLRHDSRQITARESLHAAGPFFCLEVRMASVHTRVTIRGAYFPLFIAGKAPEKRGPKEDSKVLAFSFL